MATGNGSGAPSWRDAAGVRARKIPRGLWGKVAARATVSSGGLLQGPAFWIPGLSTYIHRHGQGPFDVGIARREARAARAVNQNPGDVSDIPANGSRRVGE